MVAKPEPPERRLTEGYLNESPYTFEGEVEFLQAAGRRATRTGPGRWVRLAFLVAAAIIAGGMLRTVLLALS